MTNVTTCKLYGVPGYGSSMRTYRATVPLKDFTAAGDVAGLFVIPKGSTVVATKAFLEAETDGTLNVSVGTWAIATDGSIGTAIDADAFYASTALAPTSVAGAILAAAATAKLQTTADTIVGVTVPAQGLTTAANEGAIFVEITTIQ